MTDERLQILQMVEEGKVSATEAIRLLDALKPGARRSRRPRPSRLRVELEEGTRRTEFTVGVGLAQWLLTLVPLELKLGEQQLSVAELTHLLDEAPPGRLLTVEEGAKRVELWLET